MLPKPNDFPPFPAKITINGVVIMHVSRNLPAPVLAIRLKPTFLFLVFPRKQAVI
jgi:hypothetical protein